MEPRRFELLTSCLQIGLLFRGNGRDLGERQTASDRDCPLLTALNGPLMARRSPHCSTAHYSPASIALLWTARHQIGERLTE
jgi:hypothetical protein